MSTTPYAYKLGLGQRTGVEVSEALGRLTTKNDSNYTESLDVQAAIGQGNTAVTPIQLATYAATLANRGTRYRTHFVKAILDSNTGKTLEETQPEVMDVVEDKGETFDLVKEGMLGVAQTIPALANYPHTIACKTGSPQRSEGYYAGSTYKHYTTPPWIAYGPGGRPGNRHRHRGGIRRCRCPYRHTGGGYIQRLLCDEGRHPDRGRGGSRVAGAARNGSRCGRAPCGRHSRPCRRGAEDAGQNDAAAAPADAAATAGA